MCVRVMSEIFYTNVKAVRYFQLFYSMLFLNIDIMRKGEPFSCLIVILFSHQVTIQTILTMNVLT